MPPWPPSPRSSELGIASPSAQTPGSLPPTIHGSAQLTPPTFLLLLCTWCRAGRLPSRLYHVTWAWACPATTQFRSKVCPSATVEDEDSILTEGTGPGAVGRGARVVVDATRREGKSCPP